ncbi:MAG: hypothetical protein HPM95_03770 [Alphaproteobacteria bacterium]|nr:hypothetical protein [Alphaproteobacteria bacterium]
MKDPDQEAGWVVGCDGTPSCLHAAIIRAARDPIYFCTPDYVIREANAPIARSAATLGNRRSARPFPPSLELRPSKTPAFFDAALAGEPVALQAWVEVPGRGRGSSMCPTSRCTAVTTRSSVSRHSGETLPT